MLKNSFFPCLKLVSFLMTCVEKWYRWGRNMTGVTDPKDNPHCHKHAIKCIWKNEKNSDTLHLEQNPHSFPQPPRLWHLGPWLSSMGLLQKPHLFFCFSNLPSSVSLQGLPMGLGVLRGTCFLQTFPFRAVFYNSDLREALSSSPSQHALCARPHLLGCFLQNTHHFLKLSCCFLIS